DAQCARGLLHRVAEPAPTSSPNAGDARASRAAPAAPPGPLRGPHPDLQSCLPRTARIARTGGNPERVLMKHAVLYSSLIAAVALAACGKKEEAAPAPAPEAAAPAAAPAPAPAAELKVAID